MKNIRIITALCLIFFLTWLSYSNHFYNDFHFDDHHTIVRNQSIRELKNIPTFFKDATTTSTLPFNQAYRPGLTTLNTIDYYLAGKKVPEPFMFHVSIFISYLLLGLCCFLLFLNILKQALESNYNTFFALFGTAFFMLHTANAETINYIIARSDSFSTLMIILSFVIYIYLPKSRKLHLYFIPSILGFFVKEPSLMFVPLLFVYKIIFEQELSIKEWFTRFNISWKVFLQISIPFFLGVTFFVISRKYTPVLWESGGTDPILYFLTQPMVIVHYISNFILPVNLVVDTDWSLVKSVTDVKVIAGIFINAFIFYLIYITSKSKQNRGISFGILWFYIALIPSSSVIPFAEVLNDHRTFFPYIGLVISLIVLIRNLSLKYNIFDHPIFKTVGIICGMIILFLHGIGTYQRNKVWETEEGLWKEATIKSPLNGRAWMNYGIQLMSKADYVNADRCYDKALEILPDYSYIYINKGILNGIIGKKEDAEKHFMKALTINEGVPESYVYYAEFLIRENRFEEANIVINGGLKISPKHEQLLILQSSIQYAINNANLNTSGKVKLALSNIAQNPTPENYIELSLAYYNEGLFEKCIEAANEALKLKPEYDLAYNNICAAYNELHEWRKAVEAGEKGLSINPQNKLLQGNLSVSKSHLK